NDNQTIAMEIPIWMMPNELDCFRPLLKSDEPLTGHIDVLRIQDGKVWIWDYKPNAHLEKYASTQTYFYALMLSGRTGIPLEKFRCGYFDKYYAYVFKPELDLLELQEGLLGYE
ncbi:MAG: PD-(D/E)XK nuclease family protein, partial [Nanoarchaeota archaeon]